MHTRFALETALKLTHDITIYAFGSDNALARRLENSLQKMNMSEMKRVNKNLDLPKKYNSHMILKGLLEKIREDSHLKFITNSLQNNPSTQIHQQAIDAHNAERILTQEV